MEQTQLANDIGFGGAWFAEHHFSNYGLCASPLVMISHCAAVTRKIRLGTGIVVAPLYQPARLIAEVAMVDQLSDGRLNLGIGSGYQHFEFERFGVSLPTSKDRTMEILDMLEMGLKQPKFSYDGAYYQQPVSAISQRAVQQPGPPSGSPVPTRSSLPVRCAATTMCLCLAATAGWKSCAAPAS